MKRHIVLGAAVAALSVAPAAAGERLVEEGFFAGELSANIGFTTDYMFRGFSQTDEAPAVQGGFDYAFDNGLYVGTWGSNVNFNDSETSVELDVYGGYANSIDWFSYDVGAAYYAYPNQPKGANYDYLEVYGKIGASYSLVSVETGVYYSPEFFGDTGDAYYYYVSPTVTMPDGVLPLPVSVDGRVGIQDIEIGGDYTEWELGLNVTALTLDWRVAYTDTDQESDLGDERVVFSVGKTF